VGEVLSQAEIDALVSAHVGDNKDSDKD